MVDVGTVVQPINGSVNKNIENFFNCPNVSPGVTLIQCIIYINYSKCQIH